MSVVIGTLSYALWKQDFRNFWRELGLQYLADYLGEISQLNK